MVSRGLCNAFSVFVENNCVKDSDSSIICVVLQERYLRMYEFGTSKDVPIMQFRRSASRPSPVSLSFNPAEKCILLTYNVRTMTKTCYNQSSAKC